MREKVVAKIVINGCTNIISLIHPPVTNISKNTLFRYIQLMMYVTYNKEHIHLLIECI